MSGAAAGGVAARQHILSSGPGRTRLITDNDAVGGAGEGGALLDAVDTACDCGIDLKGWRLDLAGVRKLQGREYR